MPLFGKRQPQVIFLDSAISETEVDEAQKKLKKLRRSQPESGGCGLIVAMMAMIGLLCFVGVMIWGGINFFRYGSPLPPKPTPAQAQAPQPTATPTPTSTPIPLPTPTPANKLSLTSLKPVAASMVASSPISRPSMADSALGLVAHYGLTHTLTLTEALKLAQTLEITSLAALAETLTPKPRFPVSNTTISVVLTTSTTLSASQSLSESVTGPMIGNYELIYAQNQSEGLYSYVSGWIVEPDGITARPVATKLCHPEGCMHFPRPGMRDVANGYYEFMASPGRYWLHIENGPAYEILVQDGPPTRYEFSFRYTGDQIVSSPARSNPWDSRLGPPPVQAHAVTNQADPTPTATAPERHAIIFPIIVRDPPPVVSRKIPALEPTPIPLAPRPIRRYFPFILK